MSERGSFVTDFIYCYNCRSAIQQVLFASSICKSAIGVPVGANDDIAIFAGFIKAMPGYRGEELVIAEYRLIPSLQKAICHSMRLAVLADDGQSKIFTITAEDAN